MDKTNSEKPKSTPFKSMLRTSAVSEVIYQYNDGMARMMMLAQLCLLWMREYGDEGNDEDKKLQHLQESEDLFHQLLSSRENQIQNLKKYTNQQPDPPKSFIPLH